LDQPVGVRSRISTLAPWYTVSKTAHSGEAHSRKGAEVGMT
jgi:hypothetical protein